MPLEMKQLNILWAMDFEQMKRKKDLENLRKCVSGIYEAFQFFHFKIMWPVPSEIHILNTKYITYVKSETLNSNTFSNKSLFSNKKMRNL